MIKYEVFSTTADVGIRVLGHDYVDLYRNAVGGLNALVFGRPVDGLPAPDPAGYSFEFCGDSGENILVNLLSEVLFLLYNEGKLTVDIKFREAGKERLRCDLLIIPLPPGMEPELDIKSVTYHNLHITEKNGMKRVEIVFDI